MPVQEPSPRRPIQETRIRDDRRTSLNKTMEMSAEQKLKYDREIKTVHALQIARMELKRRGWDSQSLKMRESNPCSLKTLVDFACLNVFQKESDEEFIIRREIVLGVLNEVARKKSRRRKRSFVEWEQMKTMTEERILELLDDTITSCVRGFPSR